MHSLLSTWGAWSHSPRKSYLYDILGSKQGPMESKMICCRAPAETDAEIYSEAYLCETGMSEWKTMLLLPFPL